MNAQAGVSIENGPTIGSGRPVILAGPCVIESTEHSMAMASSIAAECQKRDLGFVFKASFDKANRTSLDSFRGPGIDMGMETLRAVKQELGVSVLTDIHETWQAERVAEVVDVIQIPAFLCRQTDLLVASAETGRVVNVKKGQFLAPHEMQHVVDKLTAAGADRIVLTERGSSFGYNTLVVDFRSLPQLRTFGVPVVFDATHSVQQPGGAGGKSGGQRQFVRYLARAAMAVGVDGLFMEVHDQPDQAPSDGPNMVPLSELGDLLDDVVSLHDTVGMLPPTVG